MTHSITVSAKLTVAVTASPNPATVGQTVTLTGTTSGGVAPVTCGWNFGDGSASGSGCSTTHTYATAGTFSAAVTATDVLGVTASNSLQVTVGTGLAATISSVTPSPSEIGVSVSFTATVTGGTAPFSFTWNFGDGSTTGTGNPTTHTYAAAGTFSVTVSVTDSASHTATSSSVSLVVNARLAVSAAASPNPTDAGVPVSFTATPAGGVGAVSCAWTFGDGGTASTCSATHTYAAAGSFTATVTATDSLSVTASASVTPVTVNAGPTVDFTFAPSNPQTGQSVTFTATTTGGTNPFTFSWNFGDGSPAGSGNPATHAYVIAGNFTVTVQAADSLGASATASHMVSVTQAVARVTIITTLSAVSIPVGGSVTDSATLFGNTASAGGTVVYNLFSTGDCSGTSTAISNVTVTNGLVPNSSARTFNVTGVFGWNALYSGDAHNTSARSSCEPLTVVVVSAHPANLTFSGFDLDDFENGAGQLQVFVNGHLVIDVPAGLNHLSGTGDYIPYMNTWVKFGPFDITSFVVQGQNTIVFKDPLMSHFGLVRNVTITQDATILLRVPGASAVFPGHSVTFTFSVPPLVITSFTISAQTANVDQNLTLTATHTGGTAPFKCTFSFGDGESATVIGSASTCSATHDYDFSGTFTVTVTVRGASTSDKVSARLTITVQ